MTGKKTIHILCGCWEYEGYNMLRAYECKAKAEAVAERLERMNPPCRWHHDYYEVKSILVKEATA